MSVRVAVVGLGYWGPNLVRVLHDLDDVELAAVCDVDVRRVERTQHRYPALRVLPSLDQIVRDPSIDAVALATPVSTHFRLGRAVLESGKHLFVEKPLAASCSDAEELCAIAQRQGVILMPGHTFLYSPPVNEVKRLIDSGQLGDIYFVSTSRVNLGLHQSDVSVLWDLAPHDFSILRYWLGSNPEEVSAVVRACIVPGTPDVAFVNLRYGTGTLAHVELSWLAPSKLRRTAVVGSRKMVVYDDTSLEPLRIFDSGVDLPDPANFGEYRLSYRTGDVISPRLDVIEPLAAELQDFLTSIRTGSAPRSSAAVGADVVALIEAAEQSAAASGAPEPVFGLALQ